MSKKDYKKFAVVLKNYYSAYSDPAKSGGSRTMWQSLVLDLADLFAEDNRKFDRNKFFDACGWPADGERR